MFKWIKNLRLTNKYKKIEDIVNNEFIFGAAAILILLVFYYAVLARGFFTNKYIFPGDTYLYWSLNYLTLYSLEHFNCLPWWDPTVYNGYPLYYHWISGWSNYLSPFYLPSLAIFKISSMLFKVSINNYIIFHRTIYVVLLNMTAIYLISQELIKKRLARIFPVLVFAFSYFQLLNFHDFYAFEAMIAPLFYIFSLIRYNNNRTAKNLSLLVLFTALYISSLNNGIMMSAVFWSGIFTFLLILFNPAIIKDTLSVLTKLVKLRIGKVIIIFSLLVLSVAFCASYSSPYYNLKNVIKYRGGPVDYQSCGSITNHPMLIEKSGIWTMGFNWFPFPEIHDFLDFAWHGHHYRYIGLATIPLILAALTLTLRNQYIYILLLTYFLCNGFIIYTTDNLFYRIALDNSDYLQNVRNTLTIFPRGGAILFLLLLSGIGLGALLKDPSDKNTPLEQGYNLSGKVFDSEIRFLMFIGVVLLLLVPLGGYYYPVALRHTLAHVGIYILVFSFISRLLFYSNQKVTNRFLLISLFIFTFTDLIISLSFNIDKKGNEYDIRSYYGRVPYDNEIVIPDKTAFHYINSESENMFPPGYSGVYHNPFEVQWGIKEWLVLATREKSQKFLNNWNPQSLRMIKYPEFKFFSNGYYLPFDKINQIDADNAIFTKEPLFYLHDESLTSSSNIQPEFIDGTYDIKYYTPNKVIISTKTDRNSFLYFLDNYDKFWSAYIDGRKTKIYRANFCFKAIKLPLGAHTVSWIYNPYPVKAAYLVFYLVLSIAITFYIRNREKFEKLTPKTLK